MLSFTGEGTAAFADIAPDGRRIAFSRSGAQRRTDLRRSSGGRRRPTAHRFARCDSAMVARRILDCLWRNAELLRRDLRPSGPTAAANVG